MTFMEGVVADTHDILVRGGVLRKNLDSLFGD